MPPVSQADSIPIEPSGKSLGLVQLFTTPWVVTLQALLSMQFSRHDYWSRLPFPSPGDLPLERDQTHLSCLSCVGRQTLSHCAVCSLCVCLCWGKRKIWWQSYEEAFQSGVLLTGICGRASVSCMDWMLSIDVLSLKQYAGDWGIIIKMINMYGSALRRNWQPSGELERKWLQFCRFCELKCLPQVHVLKT